MKKWKWENMQAEMKKEIKLIIIISMLIYFFSFLTERYWLHVEVIDFKNAKYLTVKGLFALFVCVIISGIIYAIKENRKNFHLPEVVFFKRVFIFYFGVMLIFMFITWPGIWRWDEIWVLSNSKHLWLNSNQHWLTALFYLFVLMIIPVPGMIVVVQVLIISLIVAYTLTEAEQWVKNQKLSYLLFIPFFFLPVIDNNFYPLRLPLYAFIELLFFVNILSMVRAGMKSRFIIILVITSVVLGIWRLEGLYYIGFAPLILLLIWSRMKAISKQSMSIIILIIILLIMTVRVGSNVGEKNRISDFTTVISTLRFLRHYVDNEDEFQFAQEKKEEIEKVVDLSLLKEFGVYAIWRKDIDIMKKNYTRQEYWRFLMNYLDLFMSNPKEFFKIQGQLLLVANGVIDGQREVFNSADLFNEQSQIYNPEFIKQVFSSNYLSKPINREIREKTIRLLELQNNSFWPKIIYNALIPFSLTFVLWITMLIKRKWWKNLLYLVVGFCYFIRLPLVLVSAPDTFFMYYYPSYVIGYVTLMFAVLLYVSKNKTWKFF